MKYALSTLILTFLLTSCFAQTNLDSLYGVWEDESKSDSTRILAFSDYINEGFIFSNPDSAIVLADQLNKFAEDKSNKLGFAKAWYLIGVSQHVQGNYDKAIPSLRKSQQFYDQLGNKEGIAGAMNSIANAYNYKGNYIEALKYYQKSNDAYRSIDDNPGIAKTLGNIGIIYDDQGNYSKALDYYLRSLKLNEGSGPNQSTANTLNNIGAVYGEHDEYKLALDYFLKSLAIREKLGDVRGIAGSFNNIGHIYAALGEYSKALDYQVKSLKLAEEIGDQQGKYNAIFKIGIVYAKQGKFEQAFKELGKCYEIAFKIGDRQGVVDALIYIGDMYNLNGNFAKGRLNCRKALDFLSNTNAKDLKSQACNCLYKANKGLGNGSKALEYHEQMLVLNDSLQSEETAKKLQQMEFAKQVMGDSLEQVERELKTEMVHQAEVRKTDRNRNLALGAGFFFLVLSGGFYSRWRYVKKSKAVIEKEKDRSDNLLLNILPSEIAEELKEKGSADARDFELVSILFSDFKGFTQASEKLSAKELIHEINACFKAFDLTCEKYGVEKIKTIGDAYMAAGGLPVPSKDSVRNTILAAIEMQAFISKRIKEKEAKNEVPFRMRLGIHTGPVVAGIVGVKKFQYDIWGDTVNTASRMESSGEIGKVNISVATYTLVKDDPAFTFEARGKIKAKGKGEMKMYFVSLTV